LLRCRLQQQAGASSISHEQLSFRDRRKYFEHEIKQQALSKSTDVSPDSSLVRRKKISLVSDQDLQSIKQEERECAGSFFSRDAFESL